MGAISQGWHYCYHFLQVRKLRLREVEFIKIMQLINVKTEITLPFADPLFNNYAILTLIPK